MRRTEEEIMALVDEIADYIIATGSSTRKTAKNFGISNYTVSQYMKDRLPEYDERYKKIQNILDSHQQTVDKEITQKRLREELSLFLAGKSLEEIAAMKHLSVSQISRDFSERLVNLPDISSTQLEDIREKILENSNNNLSIGNYEFVKEQKRDSNGKFR